MTFRVGKSTEDSSQMNAEGAITKPSARVWPKAIWISIVIFCIAFLIIVMLSSTRVLDVRGTSMTPGISEGDHVWSLTRLKTLSRGSLVVLYSPVSPPPMVLRRVIALPGDIVQIREGKVLINDSEIEEEYVSVEQNQRRRDMAPTRVPDHTYFVMADNRDGAYDSRDWGAIPDHEIYGKVLMQF